MPSMSRVIRTPVIPGFNDTVEEIEETEETILRRDGNLAHPSPHGACCVAYGGAEQLARQLDLAFTQVHIHRSSADTENFCFLGSFG